ncbi:VWA domain-containing protein [Tuwongella immobilis]|uniref:VWFA domain-containing protein n=1 Tax=Tuwongella immobilis TaxID=692036 RepID=A0A6C2YTB8_9BACT|nr:VWA domain-containing protein [Tuwongella immobilis]VIP04279.1 von willebrand factor type a : Uncharacterized protein OS=Planctomyces maris DSM 8797 GN=PM8797T_01844 PE=4 SV=1: VWA_3 [Tuwongella immobilis]VTS05921.1 von willebrand factor type a : Uncharacterized protein OS=Planctomyces maris DSM 8797 GN=PM8797T_01844 PE=4 SV=1: VWA_3 [Tuwongella immobilis]
MKLLRRLRAVAAGLTVVAAAASTQVWGDTDSGRSSRREIAPPTLLTRPDLSKDLSAGRFSTRPLLTYTTPEGETVFALQVRPGLSAVSARPRDIAVVIDTTASQAGKPMQMAREILEKLASQLSPVDRLSVWIANTPRTTRNLTGGFIEPTAAAIQAAVKNLKDSEYASGATDLKDAITKVSASFDQRVSRQQILFYLGDGDSAYYPLNQKERLGLVSNLTANSVSFYAVPLGPKIHAENLNSLVTGTGGSVVRVPASEKGAQRVSTLLSNFVQAAAVPVMVPTKITFADGTVSDLYPSKLPPMRADAPTLVVGKLAQATKALDATIEGTVLGKPVTVKVSEAVPASQAEHFFLLNIIDQWKESGHPEAPAMLRSDRTLALSYEQCRLARDEMLAQAHFAVTAKRFDAAETLYLAAAKFDPADLEAKTGVEVTKKLKTGAMTTDELLKSPKDLGDRIKIGRNSPEEQVAAVKVRLQELAQDGGAGAGGAAPGTAPVVPQPGTPQAAQDLLQLEQARRNVVEQQQKLIVEESLRRARELLLSDPDGSATLLKQNLSSVRDNPEIGDRLRSRLVAQLETLLRDVQTRGAFIKQQQIEERERISRARERIASEDKRVAFEERQRERIRSFANLMNQARYEEAYREALLMEQEAVDDAVPIPVETTASYIIGENATNLRELKELKRIREERYLMTMLQVEKSHVPYPDEPPVHYPPATIWRELSNARLKNYAITGFGRRESATTRDLRSKLDATFENDKEFTGSELSAVLEFISTRYNVTILIDTAAFKAEDMTREIEKAPVNLPKLSGVTLAAALRLVLSDIGADYQVRRDYIDIVPASKAYNDKVLAVFRVDDLVFQIPSAVNQQALQQNLQLQGQSFAQSVFGATGAVLGGFGGGIGGFNFGGGGGIVAPLGIGGGLQGGGAGLGGGGAGFGQQPFAGQGGAQNLGFGGGAAGFGGGQIGQFGNLGGQFGIQGNNQSQLLLDLIPQVIDRGYWDTAGVVGVPQNNDPLAGDVGGEEARGAFEQLNSLGFFPPVNALVIRGFSRRYAAPERPVRNVGGGAVMGANIPKGLEKPGALVFNPNQAPKLNGGADPKKPDVQAVVRENAKKPKDQVDPKQVWQDFIAQGVNDPQVVIGGADFLVRVGEFTHAVELLKASLRGGVTAQPWAHEALAVALQASQGASEDIERARVSGLDIDPTNANAYLSASKAMMDLKLGDAAIRFCQQAAKLQPESSEAYANALVLAGGLENPNTDVTVWAARNLLRRDWANESTDLHAQAQASLLKLEQKLAKSNQPAEAAKVRQVVTEQHQRDLVIQLLWQGDADLDLEVQEPIGSKCNPMLKQSPNGGLLTGDVLEQKSTSRSETYVASEAFSGSYAIQVNRVLGRPLGNKAMIRVTMHQGQPNQSQEVFSVNLDQSETVNIRLEAGRRTQLAQVPVVTEEDTSDTTTMDRTRKAVNRLRAMADPVMSKSPVAMTGGAMPSGMKKPLATFGEGQATMMPGFQMQTRVAPVIEGGMDFQAESKTVLTSNGSTVQTKVKPVFQTLSQQQLRVKLDLIPSGDE